MRIDCQKQAKVKKLVIGFSTKKGEIHCELIHNDFPTLMKIEIIDRNFLLLSEVPSIPTGYKNPFKEGRTEVLFPQMSKGGITGYEGFFVDLISESKIIFGISYEKNVDITNGIIKVVVYD